MSTEQYFYFYFNVPSQSHPTLAGFGFCFHWRQKCWPFREGSLFSISSLCTVMAAKLFLSLSLLKRMVHISATRSHCTEQRLMQGGHCILQSGFIYLGYPALPPLDACYSWVLFPWKQQRTLTLCSDWLSLSLRFLVFFTESSVGVRQHRCYTNMSI